MTRVTTMLLVMALIALAAAPAAMAGGGAGAGGNCPSPPCTRLVGPVLNAVIVMDPHMAAGDPILSGGGGTVPQDVTTTAKMASVQIFNNLQNGVLSQADFRITPSFQLNLGCTTDPTIATQRFVFTSTKAATLKEWIPLASLQALFLPLGIAPPANGFPQPVITQIVSQSCVDDPRNPTTADGSAPGILVMQVVIQILVAR